MLRFLTCRLFNLCLLCLLMSCHQQGPSTPLSIESVPLQHSKNAVMVDRDVRNTLLYVNAVHKKLPEGHIAVQVNFQNRLYEQDVWADVCFEFLDENNMLVEKTEWIPHFFPAAQVTTIEGSSISQNAFKHVLLMKNLQSPSGKIVGSAIEIYEYPSDTE